MMNLETILILTCKVITVPLIISSAEYLYYPRHIKADGLMSWEVAKSRSSWFCNNTTGNVFNTVLPYSAFKWLLICRLMIALITLLIPFDRQTFTLLFILLGCCEFFMVVRTPYGQDGSDQLSWITIITLCVALSVPSKNVLLISLGFLAFQVSVSYVTAGLAKAISKGWQNGDHLRSIANLRIYGNPFLARLLEKNNRLSIALSWSVILWESLFFLVFFLPEPFALVFLAAGVFFHLSNAVFMGLNCFFWSFMAGYPAIYYFISLLNDHP